MEALYKKFNYPGKQKFYQLAKKQGLKVTLKEIDDFLNKQHVSQVFSNKIVQKPGHIVAFNPDDWYGLDWYDKVWKEKQRIWVDFFIGWYIHTQGIRIYDEE